MHDRYEPFRHRHELAAVACWKARRCYGTETCAWESCFFLCVKEKGVRESPFLRGECKGTVVYIAANVEVLTAESWEIRDADTPQRLVGGHGSTDDQ